MKTFKLPLAIAIILTSILFSNSIAEIRLTLDGWITKELSPGIDDWDFDEKMDCSLILLNSDLMQDYEDLIRLYTRSEFQIIKSRYC